MTISRNLSFLAEGVSSTGVLGATYGGTGQSSITTGDLLYGSASNTISKLAIGSTGTVLRVVAGVPSWGTDYTGTVTSVAATVPSFLSISGSPITTSGTLAITYSGTALPTANGGTALTSFTANGVLYASSSSVLATGSSLQFDGTNFGIGITPTAPLHVSGLSATNSIFVTTRGSGAFIQYALGASGAVIGYIGSGGQLTTAATSDLTLRAETNLVFATNAGTERMRIFTSGGVSIGNTTDPGAGNLRFATTGTNGIYFGSSARLDDYETGTWTPSDASGAGLTFTSVTGVYTKIGRLVTCTFGITFPVTASVATVTIGNLPFTTLSSGTPNPSGGSITYTGAAVTAAGFATGAGGTSVSLYGASGAAIGNSTFSTFILRAQFTYTSN
jgi:hypothetical protein